MPLKHLTIYFDNWKKFLITLKKMNCSCPTCLETFTQDCLTYSTPCGHIFHLNCIERWLENKISCPQCRKFCKGSDLWRIYLLSEWLYNIGQSRSKFSRCQFSVWSQNQCYIFRWSLWHNKFGPVTKTEALGVILSFRGWISLYRASRQSVLFFTRYAG